MQTILARLDRINNQISAVNSPNRGDILGNEFTSPHTKTSSRYNDSDANGLGSIPSERRSNIVSRSNFN